MNFPDMVIIDPYPHFNMVSAQRIVPVRMSVCLRKLSEISRLFAMVENDILIKFCQICHTPNTSMARWTARTNASTSCFVLYIAMEARAVAGIPKRLMSG